MRGTGHYVITLPMLKIDDDRDAIQHGILAQAVRGGTLQETFDQVVVCFPQHA